MAGYIGLFQEKYSRYILECRDQDGNCVYRKFTGDDRMNFLFNKIPETKTGHMFRSRPIEDKDKNRPPLAEPLACHYISRELCKLEGRAINPEKDRNDRTMRDHNRKTGALHRVHKDLSRMPLRSQLVREPDYTVDPKEWQPSQDGLEIRELIKGQIPDAAAFPVEEVAPKGFKMDDWKDGKAAPVLSTAGPARKQTPATEAASPKDEQFQVKGKQQTRSERMAEKAK